VTLVDSISAIDCLERLVSKITCPKWRVICQVGR